MCFSSMLKGQKDCGMNVRAPLAMVIGIELDTSTYLVVETMGATITSYATK